MDTPRARIGWITGNDLFLDPTTRYEVVQQMAGAERLPMSARRCAIGCASRASLEGRARQVLHLKDGDLMTCTKS
jgi:hypothetical protein